MNRAHFHRNSFAMLWSTWKRLVYNYGRGLVGKKRHPLRLHLERLESRLQHHAARISSDLRDELCTMTPFTDSSIQLDYFDTNLVYMVNKFDLHCFAFSGKPEGVALNGTLAEEDEKVIIGATKAGDRHAKKLVADGTGFLRKKHLRLVDLPPLANVSDSLLSLPQEPIVPWDSLTLADLRRLEQAVANASGEADLQRFLQENPSFLIQHLGGGHGRWVIPQQRLGCQFVTDFVVGERHSFGMEWHPVELESPTAKLFTKAGDLSATLNHAIRQILDWRRWLSDNLDYARKPRDQNGLGLIDIHSSSPALILIGRASSLNIQLNRLRQDLIYQLGIQIRTYDFLIEITRGRLRSSRTSEA